MGFSQDQIPELPVPLFPACDERQREKVIIFAEL
jgi:hypothetical protein